MSPLDEGRGLLCALLALAYGLQLVQVCLLPVPSSFSTWSLLTSGQCAEEPGNQAPSGPRLLLLAAAAGGALLAALLPLLVCVFPALYPALLPLAIPGPWNLALASLLLLFGNGLSLVAVLTLRARATFDASGETEVLLTRGIFRLVRHPVLVGLGAIYLGLLLLLPSLLMAIGFVLFVSNARVRMAYEEARLARRFGASYQNYAAKVGRLGPKRQP